MKSVIKILATGALLIALGNVQAQNQTFEIPTTNPRAKVEQRVAATDITVSYNRPSVKGRKIFGDLIPFNQVWRTGSDASTKLSFSTPVLINGKSVNAGTYELFTIPGEREWIIILQENRNQWGSYTYNPENDVMRTEVISEHLPNSVETFTISFANVKSNSCDFSVEWDNMKVSFPITIDLQATVVPQLEASLNQEGKRPYFRAAMFYYENDLNINRAAELMQLAIDENPNHLGMLFRMALILERKGDVKGAIAASEKSLSEARKASKELQDEYVKLNTDLLSRLRK